MATVKAMAERLGWIAVHFPNAVINPPGWPDLTLIKGRRTSLPLKRHRGKLGPKREVIAARVCRRQVYLWYR